MKLHLTKTGLFFFLFLIGIFPIHAQEQASETHRYIGIGIRASIFQISELPYNIVPANRLLVNVNPIKYVRLEGHFATYSQSQEKNFSSPTGGIMQLTLKEKSNLIGGGVFGVYPKDNIKFIVGLRYSHNNYYQDNVTYTSSYPSSPYVVTDKGYITILAYVIGAEYAFNKWFSIGAEFSLVKMNDTFHPWDASIPPTSTNTRISESGLVFRFYPF